jgi:hypothetical protein
MIPLLALGSVAVPVQAAPAPAFELSVVRLDGSGSCPGATAFRSRVATRLGREPFGQPAERAIETVLSRQADAWRAEITLRDATGIVQGRRTIEAVGTDCGPLFEATALAIAIAIDPEAALGPAPPAPVAAPPPAPPPVEVAPAPADCPKATCPTAPPCPRAACPRDVPRTGTHVAVSARAALAGGMLPRPVPGFALSAEAGSGAVRAELELLYLPEAVAEDRRFSFGLTTAGVGVCGALSPHPRLELGICAGVQLGAIYSVVRDAPALDAGDETWLAAAVGPRLRVEPASPFLLDVGVSAVVPLQRPAFALAGVEKPVFEPARVGVLAFVGVGVGSP